MIHTMTYTCRLLSECVQYNIYFISLSQNDILSPQKRSFGA